MRKYRQMFGRFFERLFGPSCDDMSPWNRVEPKFYMTPTDLEVGYLFFYETSDGVRGRVTLKRYSRVTSIEDIKEVELQIAGWLDVTTKITVTNFVRLEA